MNDSNSSSNSTTRVTLKLKAGARKSPPEQVTAPARPPDGKSKAKPGARWSDEYTRRMQAEMDLLTSR